MLQLAIEKSKNYWADGWYVLLFALALIYVLICVKEKKAKKTLLWYSGLFVAVFFCPLTIKIITVFIGKSVFWRMFWILPTSVITAFAFTHLYEKINAKWIKAIAVLAMVAVIALSGAWMYSNREFRIAPNWHKVSPAVPEVCEIITSDAEQQGLQPKALVADSLLTEIRQYDATIGMAYGRKAQRGGGTKMAKRLYEQMQREMPQFAKLKRNLSKIDCNYVVWRGNEDSHRGFEEAGFRLVGQVEDYKIYFFDIE